jgi:hypothetical protein
MTVSLDGFVAGPDQKPDDPMGGGGRPHRWMFDQPEENADSPLTHLRCRVLR